MQSFARSVVWVVAVFSFLVCSGCGGGKNTFVPPPPPKVTVSHPVKEEITDYFEATGTTAALESVEIRARVQGYLEKVDFKPRAEVKEGDQLFLIDPKPFEATVAHAKAVLDGKKAQLNLAEVELDKATTLYDKAAISELKSLEAKAKRDLTKSQVEKAKADLESAELNLGYTKVTAPISGRVSRNLVDVGNLVGAGERTLLTTIVNDKSIYAYFNVSELNMLRFARKYAKNEKKIPAERRLEEDPTPAFLKLGDETGFPHKGRVDYADTQVDPDTGTIQVRAIFPNSTGLIIPGMFVRVRMPIQTREAFLVPDVAVQADQGGRYVLVVNEKNTVEQRKVKMGTLVKQMRVIEEGVTAKDRIIVNGLQRARPGAEVNPTMASEEPKKPKKEPSPGKKPESSNVQ